MGAAFVTVAGQGSLVDLIEIPKGPPPAMSFTWASEVPFFALGANPPATATLSSVAAISGPTPTATFHRIHFTAKSLAVKWSLSSGGAVVVAILNFNGSGCRSPGLTYVHAVHGASGGTIVVPSRGRYRANHEYSIRVLVGVQRGPIKSGCMNIGMFRRRQR
jgi:hypothetical protein